MQQRRDLRCCVPESGQKATQWRRTLNRCRTHEKQTKVGIPKRKVCRKVIEKIENKAKSKGKVIS